MKIRNGFVSNSSSSSFLIYGTIVDNDIIENKFKEICKEEYLELFNDYGEDWNEDTRDLFSKMNKQLNFNLSSYIPFDDIYVGRSWDSIEDEETGLQFKQSVENQLKELFGNNIKCGTLEEAWRDG